MTTEDMTAEEKLENIKKEFLESGKLTGIYEYEMDPEDGIGISLKWRESTKIGIFCQTIFEGYHFDDNIECNPEVDLFDSAEKCWNRFEHTISGYIAW